MSGKQHLATAKKKELFIKALSECGVVSVAAEAATVDRATPYKWRADDDEFAADWESSIEVASDALEFEARKRAFDGSDTLLIFLLKGHKPQKYRERYDVQQHIKADVTLRHSAEECSDDELAGIIKAG